MRSYTRISRLEKSKSTGSFLAALKPRAELKSSRAAVFAATFYATLGAVKAINALEMAFPSDVSLLGFEHSEWMTAVRPYLSAVEQPVGDMAMRSWHALRERIAGDDGDFKRVLLDFRFIIRESTRPPR